MPIDHMRIRANGWRQGSVFSVEDTAALSNDQVAGSRLVVVTHDCDLVHNGEYEPHIEVCLAEHLENGVDGNYRWARHPRRLDLQLNIDGAPAAFCLHAAKKHRLDRSRLEDLRPDASALLSEVELTRLTVWLAKRYTRAALPDVFNLRLQTAQTRIRRLLRRDGTHLSSLLISLKPFEELTEGDEYDVHIVGLVRHEHHENGELRAQLNATVNQVSSLVEQCAGINVLDTDVLSEDEFTLHNLQYFVELTLDDLSLRTNPPDSRLARI